MPLINQLQYGRSFMTAIKESLKSNYFTFEKKIMISIIRKICFVPSVRVSANKKQETYLKLG